MTTTKEDIYEATYYEGWGARRDNIPRWCNTYEGRLKQIWQTGWDKKDKELKEKND